MLWVMSTNPPQRTEYRLLLRAAGVAEFLDISARHVFALNTSGRLPSAIRLGNSVRWDRREIERWIAAGAPPREEWEQMKAAGGSQ